MIGSGSYLPPNVVTNDDLAKIVDTSDAWIQERTGIRQRHIATSESTLDLAEQSALQALAAAGKKAQDIDLLIVATTTPDRIFPSTATLLQARLGISGCPAFDLQAVCSGFVYGLGVVNAFIKTGMCKNALLVGAETLSRIIDWTDRSTCVLFGDGAGAVVITADTAPGILSTHLYADGKYQDLLTVPKGVGQNNADLSPYIQMKGSEVFKISVATLDQLVEDTLSANKLAKSDLDWLIPHQANLRIIQATAKRLQLPLARVVLTLQKHGNTSAASIPLALDDAWRGGQLKVGDLLLFEAFGGGFTWGSALVRL
jgi:3-oxoacyl-[acyl-carrier-protein] synthase-3